MFTNIRGAMLAATIGVTAALHPSLSMAETLHINVPVGQDGTLTAPSTAQITEEVKAIPGGADVVPAEAFEKSYALSMKDMLATTPGVLAQPRWGEESRLSIRGSGLSRGFHMRGIKLLQDGIPFNFADGSSDFQEIDPLILRHLEVYRGGQGLRYGASTLGGAINMVTPTAQTVDYNGLLRVEGGSYGTMRLHAQAAQTFDGADAFVAATKSFTDGYRQQSESNNTRFSGNVGVPIGDRAETRFYISRNDINQEVPSTLSKDDALHNPQSVLPVNIVGDYARDINSLRLANRTVFELDNGLNVEAGGFINDKSLYHPIFQVIDQESRDYGAFGRIKGSHGANDFMLGMNIGRGVNDADRFVNIRGSRGAKTADAKQVAENIELYGENSFEFIPQWNFITGLQATLSRRDYEDHLNAANDDDHVYRSLNPKIGVLWETTPATEIYASVTKSSEAPTFSELVQMPVSGFVPLDAQEAWTAEIGTRGEEGRFSWDATLYHARVKNELLQFAVGADIPASTFNADKTIHQGIELGAGWRMSETISFQGVYNLSDFHFDGDEQFGDNELAGAPMYHFRFAARYERGGAYIEPNVEYVPESAWVDYANTLKSDSYATLGLKAGWDVNDSVSIFVDGRNLTGEDHITSFTTVTDARTANTDVFYPGEGRSVFGGVQVKF